MTLLRGLSEWPARLQRACPSLLKKLVLLPASLRLLHTEFQIPGEDGVQGAYLGEGLSFPYYRKLYGASVTCSMRVPIWRCRRLLLEALGRCAVVLVEVNPLLGFLLPGGGWIAAPWVRQETDLTGERYLRRQRGIERGWGQKVRQHGFQCRISRRKDDLEAFYREHYLPYASQRHGEEASVRGLAELRGALRSGFLLQVWQDGDWVSGLVVSRPCPDRVRLLAAGLKSPSPDRLRLGALSATYYFLFRWAKENGLRAVDFCGSRPHLMDGVYRHKSLWAADPKHDPWHHTEIVLFLARGATLPETVTQQLVSVSGRFVTIGECLERGPSRP